MSVYQDIDLLEDFRHGRKAAFDELFQRYYNLMYVFAYRLINDSEEAKDIAIRSLTALFRLHGNFDSIMNIRAFLYMSTRNACFNYLKYLKRAKTKHIGLKQALEGQNTVRNDAIDGAFIRKIYHSAIEELPQRTRQVLEKLYSEKLTYQQVADQLLISPNTVKNLRIFAIKRMRQLLQDKGITPELLELLMTALVCFILHK
jgi:RNA polymerase sigma-70 factor (ECF subfamily)